MIRSAVQRNLSRCVARLAGALAASSILILMSCTEPETPLPPVAKAEPHQQSIHGETRVDRYHWLRDRGSPEVIDYLEAENAHTEAVMAHTKPLQEALYEEMLGRIKETDIDVPVRIDNYFYYSRTEEGKQYRIHCRKKGSLESAEEIILDQNELAKDTEYFRLGVFEVSPGHRLLAYSSDTDRLGDLHSPGEEPRNRGASGGRNPQYLLLGRMGQRQAHAFL